MVRGYTSDWMSLHFGKLRETTSMSTLSEASRVTHSDPLLAPHDLFRSLGPTRDFHYVIQNAAIMSSEFNPEDVMVSSTLVGTQPITLPVSVTALLKKIEV